MKKKTLIILISAFVLLAVAVLGLILFLPRIKGYMEFQDDKNGKDQPDISYVLTIEKTDYENEVAAKLAENGIIISSARFLNYIHEKHPDFVWYNGIYELNANMSYEELCDALSNPKTRINYVKFVVPEGKSVVDIASIVEKSGLCTAKEFLKAADSYDYDFAFMDELKARNQNLIGYKLEGFLFPATYEFRADTVTAEEIVAKMLETFEGYVSEEMIEKANYMGLSLNEFVTLASVIQAEAFSTESMSGVSSVFWNRLNSSEYPRLQSDPTMKYAASLKELGHYSVAMKQAYDTYQCSDLPVGPTNCPGIDSMKAVLEPDETDYFYFVTDKDGNFYYNETLRGHNRIIADLKSKGLWA